MTGDYIPPNRKLYLTPDNVPVGRFCRQFPIPDSPAWIGLVDGVLSELMSPSAWRAYGELTPEETAEAWQAMIFEFWESTSCAPNTVDTPYWDDSSDVDDEMSVDDQPWYGKVLDPSLPPNELSFIEDALIWAFTGLLAVATVEIGFAPAIAFRTVAPQMVLAVRNFDVGRIYRIFMDGALAYQGTDDGSGAITEVPIIGDPSLETHQLYITSGAT